MISAEPVRAERQYVLSLYRIERARGCSAPAAWANVARRARLGLGSLQNIVRNRVKKIDGQVRDRLQALLIREIEAEIARWIHELELARQGSARLAGERVGEAEAHLEALKALMREAGR